VLRYLEALLFSKLDFGLPQLVKTGLVFVRPEVIAFSSTYCISQIFYYAIKVLKEAHNNLICSSVKPKLGSVGLSINQRSVL
jgi:hypothetical protein